MPINIKFKKLNLLPVLLYIAINSCANNSIENDSTGEFNFINNIGIRVVNYNICKDIKSKIIRINGQVEIKNISQNNLYGHGFYRVMLKDKKGNIIQMQRSEDETKMKIKPYFIEPGKSNIRHFDGGLYTNNYKGTSKYCSF